MPEFVRELGPQGTEAVQKLLWSRTVPAGVYIRTLIVHWSSRAGAQVRPCREVDPPFQ